MDLVWVGSELSLILYKKQRIPRPAQNTQQLEIKEPPKIEKKAKKEKKKGTKTSREPTSSTKKATKTPDNKLIIS